MRYSLRQLEVFLATAKHENVSHAAEELAMSQSAASASLKELETQFGIALFDRIGKRLHLSSLGQQLRSRAQHLLDEAKAFEQTLVAEDSGGTINIGATLTIGNYLTLRMIADFRRKEPNSTVNLQIANTQDIANRVARFELDMGLIEGEIHNDDLEILHWRRDELVVFANPKHPLAKSKRIPDKALRELQWIVREPGSGTRQAFDRAMHGILPDLTIAMELEQPKAIKHAVELGLGVGCLSAISLEEPFNRGSLVPLAVPHRDLHREWFLIMHRDKFKSPTLERWLDTCQTQWSKT
ncbi:MAG: LysR substrate-binding domain-containing protein [Halioglobus sp.]